MPRIMEIHSRRDMGSQELTDEIIRIRAYQRFEKRGYQHGSDLEDWLAAEAEIRGTKSSAFAAESGHIELAASVAA